MIGIIGLLNSPRVGNVSKVIAGGVSLTVEGYTLSGSSFKGVLLDYKRKKGNLTRKDQDKLIRAFCSSYPGECLSASSSAQSTVGRRCSSCGGGRAR